MLFIDADTDETGRYVFFFTNKGTSNRNELFVKDLGSPIAPKLDAPVRALYPGHTAAYDPQTGKEIWGVNYPDGFSNVPRPVYGDGMVYITTGFQQPAILAIRADGTGDVTKTHIAWTLSRGAPLTPSPLLVGDALYVVNDGGILSCLDATTGETRWVQRLGGSYSASPV